MISRRRFLLGLWPAGLAAGWPSPAVTTEAFEPAKAVVRDAVARGDLPGAVLHIRARGRVLAEEAFGRARIEDDVALTPGHIFPVASLTKPIVAAAILQLSEARKLRVDDPVAAYLPEFSRPRVLLKYDAATGAMSTRPARRALILRDLLTHTAGIHHGFVEIDPVLGAIYEKAGVVYDSRSLLAEKVRRLGPTRRRRSSSRSGCGARTSSCRPRSGRTTAFGFRWGFSLAVSTPNGRGQSALPVGGFGWYGIYGTWFWAMPRHQAVVLLFANVLSADMTLPLFARVVQAIGERLRTAHDARFGSA